MLQDYKRADFIKPEGRERGRKGEKEIRIRRRGEGAERRKWKRRVFRFEF